MVKDFYLLDAPYGSYCMYVAIDLNGDTATDYSHGEGAQHVSFTANYRLGRTKPSDFVGTTLAHPLLISEKVRRIFLEHQITGWLSWPCEIIGNRGERFQYHLLGVSGLCRDISFNVDNVIYREINGRGVEYVKGLNFNRRTWDGSDIFMCRDKGYRLISERLMKVMKAEKVSGVRLPRLDEVEAMAIAVMK